MNYICKPTKPSDHPSPRGTATGSGRWAELLPGRSLDLGGGVCLTREFAVDTADSRIPSEIPPCYVLAQSFEGSVPKGMISHSR